MPAHGLFGSLRAEHGRRAKARRYVLAVRAEPPEHTVRALAAAGDGDADHARWELRYLRRAMGLLVAERDALDDQTASDVAAELEVAHRADTNIAAERIGVAARQLNDRLSAYRAVLAERMTGREATERLGRLLLAFARAATPDDNAVQMATAITSDIIAECNAALREHYGEAKLPDDIKPSEL